MDKAEVIEILKLYKELISKHMDSESMILFAFDTRGAQREDSDIDVAVVVDETSGGFFETRPILWKLNQEGDDRIESVIPERKHDESGFLAEVWRSGLVIWEKAECTDTSDKLLLSTTGRSSGKNSTPEIKSPARLAELTIGDRYFSARLT